MIRVMVVRIDGYVETADTWARMVSDEGYDVVTVGPFDATADPDADPATGPDIDDIAARAQQDEVDVVVCPGADHDWRHDLKKRLHGDGIGVAPPECDGADLLDWVAKRETSGAGSAYDSGGS